MTADSHPVPVGAAGSAVAARQAAIERSGWGNRMSLWQPRNACYWLFLIALGYGLYYMADYANVHIRLYAPALAVNSIVFAFYALLFWWFTTRIDRYSSQPVAVKVAAFVWGGFVAPWTIAMNGNTALIDLLGKLFGQNFADNWGAGIAAPIFEELGKGSGVLLLLFLAPRVVRTAYDGFIIGAFAGLGFEILEDILYALNAAGEQFGSDQLGSSLSTTALRLLTGFSSHIAYTAIFGTGVVFLIGTVAQRRRTGLGLGLMLTAMVLHGWWDAGAVLSGGNLLVSYIMLVAELAIALSIVVTVFNHTVKPERAAMRTVMQPEADAGVITGEELDALAGDRKQRRAYRKAALGKADRSHRQHRLEAAHDLADQLAAAGGKETERVRFTRDELRRLSPTA
ncbi:PrsW family intramembrane metalloprotease [Actinoplanes sp. M2I2]|uniref:PrsW family intramembrane metalloprotease n=1 Tax=Actinoplanes sp. M2I2 TaxID=1734444 RepID=UPI00202200BA|nr:PrsW family intramembrane metalloprotease [Actinoplanes sp. M2I2]